MVTGAPAGQDIQNVDLVLEGGGVKGIGLVGALAVLEERGFTVQNIAGTSAGAIVATGLAAGYTAAEQRDILAGLDFTQFTDRGWEDRLPFGAALSTLKDWGHFEGDAFLEWMRALLVTKGVRTFGDLVIPKYADQPRYRYKVQVIASDLTDRRLLVLPQDAPRLGISNPDDLDVALAVRMSMSIPFFFEPVRWPNPDTGRDHIIVDGGMLSNFPVWLFDVEGEPDWPTFGLRLVEPEPKVPLGARLPQPPEGEMKTVVDYLKSLIQTMLEAHDRLYIESAEFARTIAIPTLGVGSTEFTLSQARALELYQSGRAAAESFLETWSFPDYIAAFRSGKEHHRRRELADDLRRAGAASSEIRS